MTLFTARNSYIFLLVCVVGLMGYGLYSQYVDGLQPCPLCMTQRFFYCLIGLWALLALLQRPGAIGRKVYAVLLSLSALGGIASAGRQVWLQHLPPEQVPACGPDLAYMLDVLPFNEVLIALIAGDGNCAEIDWQFLGLSMAEWSLLWFIVLLLVSIRTALRS